MAFPMLFKALYETIEDVTHKPSRLARFDEGGPLQCIIMDANAAQAGGLGDFLVSRCSSTVEGVDWLDALAYIMKTCLVHDVLNK